MERSRIQGPHQNIVKAIYSKPVANINLSREKPEAIPVKLGTRQGCPLSPYLFSIVLEILTRAIRQQKEIEGIQIGKGKINLSLFTDEMMIYLSDSKNSTTELLKQINNFSKLTGYKVVQNNKTKTKTNKQTKTKNKKSVAFLYSKNKQAEKV